MLESFDLADSKQKIFQRLEELITKFKNESPPETAKKAKSNGELSRDPTFYTGTSGNIFTYYRLYKFFKTSD